MRTSYSLVLAAFVLAAIAPMSALAKAPVRGNDDRGLHLGQRISAEVRSELRDRKDEGEAEHTAESVKRAVKKMTVKGTLAVISGSDLTIRKANGETVVVHAADAKLVGRYGAKTTFASLRVDDQVEAVGTRSATTTTELTATHVRDLSIEAGRGTFVGTVKSIHASTTSFVLAPIARSERTVVVSGDTELTKNGETIRFADIVVGNSIRVFGTWDRASGPLSAKTVAVTTPLVRRHISGRVTVDGNDRVSVLADDQVTYVVRLGGASTVYSTFMKMNKNSITVGDQLDIWAKSEASSTNLKAYFIRDLSQQDRLTRVVTKQDQNRTLQAEVGDRIVLRLGSDDVWGTATSTNAAVLAPSTGKALSFDAKSVGQSVLTVAGEPRCRQSTPSCATPSVLFRVTVSVVAKP